MSEYPEWSAISTSTRVRTKTFPRLLEDMPTFLGVPVALSPKDLEGADVVIIGAPFAAGWGDKYSGVDKSLWLAGPKRVRQQSIRYTGYVQDFDLDIFDHLKVVDYGDAAIPPEANYVATVENILRAQAAVEVKVNQALDAGAVPIVIGQNSPPGSYAIAKPIGERAKGNVGMISLDTHWDSRPMDHATADARIAGSGNWKSKLYELHANYKWSNVVEVGERGMLEDKTYVRHFVKEGANFVPMWKIRGKFGLDGLIGLLSKAYEGTSDVYVHFDMDVLGGAGPAPGDLLGELAEPIGMTDYEVIRIAHEIGLRGLTGMSFICIPPGSAVIYRTIVYVITYLMAGLAMRKKANAGRIAPLKPGEAAPSP
ncbi:MAG: arginase family protein [Betaproteobacteria bacterium]|nr:arginase family protein [Betaproteobacteria bacterium]